MDKHIKILNEIFPFTYLKNHEKQALIEHSQFAKFQKDNIVIKTASTENFNELFLLLKGDVSVILGNETVGVISAPSYFGERSVFLQQPRHATIVANTAIECLMADGDYIHKLLETNLHFCYAFATSLRTKHKIFDNYDEFINLLKQKKISSKLRVLRLLEPYRSLSPILHKHCNDKQIDFFALSYVLSKLPDRLSTTNRIVLTPDLPEQFKKIQSKVKLEIFPNQRRNFYEVLPGQLVAILRDGSTDYIDIISKLCAYSVETKKIAERLLTKPSAMELLSKYYYGTAEDKKQILEKTLNLPFTEAELKKLATIFKKNWLEKLYEIAFQKGDMEVQTIFPKVRYYSDTAEIWIAQITKLLTDNFSYSPFHADVDVHIVSSNMHSVLNCLSPWVHQKSHDLLTQINPHHLENQSDRLYASIRDLLHSNRKIIKEKHLFEKKNGFFHLDNPSLTGIDVNVMDLSMLTQHIDPYLQGFPPQKKAILFNIDYAYGKQAETIIRSLILLFGKQIKSVSILGKAGSIGGERGELMLPEHFIIQENDSTYSIQPTDLSQQDFTNVGWPTKIHQGSMLTVTGTLMQSAEMLWFYKNFWNVIGMEMEGGFFLQEINRAKIQNLIHPDLMLRFAYYISDTPLHEEKTLAHRLSIREGLPAVYAITRVILKKILEANNEK